jgi:uncharacterized BrkB/YihY/UPF0761 family membrane protein
VAGLACIAERRADSSCTLRRRMSSTVRSYTVNPCAISRLLSETGYEWYADRVPRLGAALAFYTLFSLAPLLVVVIAIAAITIHGS